jgi:hypothetical protein
MSGIVNNRIFLDGLREREAVAGAIAGALYDLEAYAARTGERVIWDTINFESWSDYAPPSDHEVRTLRIGACTIDPAEVPNA